jgi:hypothetical protein
MANVPISTFTVPANTVGIGATGYSLTGSASASFMDLAGTWNTSGTPTAIKLNITDTASNAASLLMDLQVGGASRFNVTKGAAVTAGAYNSQNNLIGTSSNVATAGAYLQSTGVLRLNDGGSNGSFAAATWKWPSGAAIGWVATTDGNGQPLDTILTRRGAANLRLGAADAATPVAQTLSVQSVVATGANQAGADFTITGSQGRGSGAGGSIIFQVAPAGTSGSGLQNALVTALTIDSTRLATFAGNVSLPATGAILGGANCTLQFDSGNEGYTFSRGLGGTARVYIAVDTVTTGSDGSFNWSSTNAATGTRDVRLFRDAANTLALRNGAAAQEFRVYETTTGTIYKAILGNRQLMKIAGAAFDNGAGANAGTLANSPVTGNPTKWIPIDDNGTTRYIPAW